MKSKGSQYPSSGLGASFVLAHEIGHSLGQNYVRGVRQIDLSARQNLKSRTGGTSVVIVLYLCNARSATYSY